MILSKFFIKVPSFPSKSVTKVTSITELTKRRDNLNQFLKDLVKRSDLISNIYVIKFLKLENHFSDFNLFQPLLLYNLDDLPYPVTAFHFDKRTNLMFIGLSNSSISGKINNYFSKFKLFSNKDSGAGINISGVLMIYNLIKNNYGEVHLEQLYEKPFNSEVCSINFYEKQNMLCLGFSNGTMIINKIYINESSKISKELVEEVCTVKAHKKKIVGVCINFSTGYIYSVARESNLNISEINYQSLMKSIQLSKKEISTMVYDETWNRLFLGDDTGSVWIIDITSPVY